MVFEQLKVDNSERSPGHQNQRREEVEQNNINFLTSVDKPLHFICSWKSNESSIQRTIIKVVCRSYPNNSLEFSLNGMK